MHEPKGMFTVAGEPTCVAEARRHILCAFEDLEFFDDGHRYLLHGRQLPSVSNVCKRFIREPFNEQLQATRYAAKHGQTPDYWIQQWRQNAFRATTLGTRTHAYGESLGYLRAGLPERICPELRAQYMPQYAFLAPLHPKEEALLKFMNEMPAAMHLVLNEAKTYSGNCTADGRGLREQIGGTFDMLYYTDGTDRQPAGFILLDYKTNNSLANDYNRRFGRMLKEPFAYLTEEDLSLYTIQLSLYALMLQDIGIPVIDRRIVWLGNSDYRTISVPDVGALLRQTL